MFKEYNELELEPFLEDVDGVDYEHAYKNRVLFALIDDELNACTDKQNIQNALNYISHARWDRPVAILDEQSFEDLDHKYLEIKSESSMDSVQEDAESESVEDLDLFLQNEDDLLTSENSAPVIKLVNMLFVQAVSQRATDIHIETYEFQGIIKFRIDGVLKEITTVKKNIITSVINRIKVMSDLDIAESRIPQDGRTKISVAKKQVDIRVSILPTFFGEKVVMRLLMKADSIPTLEGLGFTPDVTEQLSSLLNYSYGMVLITGPTGSGKSTTLHSFLKKIDHSKKNIVTVENPVEYNSFGINQVQVNEKAGLTFASALKSILRQDPDVILVGEIRDLETTEIAVQASMTGHLLLSTLHTNSAAGAIPRLVDIGIDSFLLSGTIIGVLAQRLVRLLCNDCKKEAMATPNDCEYFNLPANSKVYEACGCDKCDQSGYNSRRAIGEIIKVDKDMSELIKGNPDEFTIKKHLKNDPKFVSLFDRLNELIVNGETSLEEALRIGVKEL
ncbi:MAG: type II/IV secretion system protein [Helicobacteraceae bacterium]|nr:type II/IV secretion system protein [Helicobacteraceae bacterium]